MLNLKCPHFFVFCTHSSSPSPPPSSILFPFTFLHLPFSMPPLSPRIPSHPTSPLLLLIYCTLPFHLPHFHHLPHTPSHLPHFLHLQYPTSPSSPPAGILGGGVIVGGTNSVASTYSSASSSLSLSTDGC